MKTTILLLLLLSFGASCGPYHRTVKIGTKVGDKDSVIAEGNVVGRMTYKDVDFLFLAIRRKGSPPPEIFARYSSPMVILQRGIVYLVGKRAIAQTPVSEGGAEGTTFVVEVVNENATRYYHIKHEPGQKVRIRPKRADGSFGAAVVLESNSYVDVTRLPGGDATVGVPVPLGPGPISDAGVAAFLDEVKAACDAANVP